MPHSYVTRLECSVCNKTYAAGKAWNLCECGSPLLVRYDLDTVREAWSRDGLAASANSMWRYSPVRPGTDAANIVTLGEGMTPVLPAKRTGARIGAADLLIKDEGLNPTGSFKARGLSCAVSMCV